MERMWNEFKRKIRPKLDECVYGDFTILHLAAQSGRTDLVASLLNLGAYINAHQCSPLYIATEYNQVEVVKLLLKEGAVIEMNGDKGTPLHAAAKAGNEELVSLLVQYGAHVDKPDGRGATPFHCAAENGHLGVALFLIQKGADVRRTNDLNETALHRTRSLKIAELLLTSDDIDVDAKDQRGRTALHSAAEYGSEGVALALIKAGAKINELDGGGLAALHHAIRCGKDRLVSVLIGLGADIDLKTAKGDNALSLAYRQKEYRIVRLILARISLRVANLNVCSNNLKAIPEDQMPELYNKLAGFKTRCRYELDQMKHHNLGCTFITLFDILYHRDPRYLRNRALINTLNSVDLNEYPLYGRLIEDMIERDKPRRMLFVAARRCLDVLLKTCYNPADTVICYLSGDLRGKILEYLDNEDLEFLILSCESIDA